MKIEEKFNLREAKLLDARNPTIKFLPTYPMGIRVNQIRATFHPATAGDAVADLRKLHMHMTPDEAFDFAMGLLRAVQDSRKG